MLQSRLRAHDTFTVHDAQARRAKEPAQRGSAGYECAGKMGAP